MATQFSVIHRGRVSRVGAILAAACLFTWSPLRVGFALADGQTPEELASRAKSILETNCHRCHGKDGTVEGGMNFILDRERLVSRRKITPGESANSKLYQRVSEGEMPPEDEAPRPTAADVAVLKRWIDAGAPDFNVKPAKRQAISQRREVLQFILSDLRQRDAGETRFLRYFTLTHLYNNGLSDDELETYRQGLSKLVNSLS